MIDLAAVAQSFIEIPAILKKAETHCFEFSMEFLKQESGNFKRKSLYFDADGLVAIYECSRDGLDYEIRITPRKEKV